jgi:c-di-AMP phosphodiesterase-like protein
MFEKKLNTDSVLGICKKYHNNFLELVDVTDDKKAIRGFRHSLASMITDILEHYAKAYIISLRQWDVDKTSAVGSVRTANE